jgi:hypothetical protein
MGGNGRDRTENTRKLKSVFRPEIFRIFRWIPATCSAFQQDQLTGMIDVGILYFTILNLR